MPSDTLPLRIALTPGEPAGIGPDICVQLAQSAYPFELVAIADPQLLQQRAELLRLPLILNRYTPESAARAQRPGNLTVLPTSLATPAQCGQPDRRNAAYVLETLERAAEGCLNGEFAALVTGPVHKGVINDAGLAFTGHTEHLAALCGGDPVMLLSAPGLRVALATTHLPLAEVSAAITPERLRKVLSVLDCDLYRRFGIERPRILVCGLNPHAGEGGHLGGEEIAVIEPTLEALRLEGLNLIGPLPADSAFTPPHLEGADAVLAMYHDQGLPVLKHLGFGRAVNITLGLPIIRTSVDHGTALELAGTGKAHTGSLRAALETAVEMALRTRE